jgi:riboflavin synthase
MFTGIVQAVGRIVRVKPFEIDAGTLDLRGVAIGDSICVQGACLTVTKMRVTKKRRRSLFFDVSRETLDCTTGLGRAGLVNLEQSLSLGDKLGGHLVTGHVDAVGTVASVKGSVYRFRAPKALSKYIARKGSITVDGVSLTVNRVRGTAFEVNLIPHTLAVTTLGRLERGAKVNLEVDLIARYVERMLS